MLNIAVFGSGKGSNFQAILTSIQERRLKGARVVLVVSNNSGAGILEIARSNNIPSLHMSRSQFVSEDDFISAVLRTLTEHGADFIALAGYMKRLHPRIIRAYRNRIINIHPALLPKHGGHGMYGIHVHEAVIAAHERVSGATVHVVDEEYDHGHVVLQRRVSVDPVDTPESLAAKVLRLEHELYPEAIQLFAEGKVTFSDQEVVVQS